MTLDRKGILSYLAITFGITYAIELAAILAGFRISGIPAAFGQYTVLAAMWIPAFATIVTTKLITHEGLGIANIRFGSWKPYVGAAILIPVCFLVVYALTWLLGLGRPDWQMSELYALAAQAGADMSQAPPPGLLLAVLFVSSLFAGPFFNSLFGFGEELGWRGYLLPKLMPLGKLKAYILVGVIWGLWHAPLILIGFNYPGYPVVGILFFMALTTALSLYMNEQTLYYRSSILAGWIHGVFNAQGYGIWRQIFPGVNPLLGGFTGVIGIFVWLVVGIITMRRHQAEPAPIAAIPTARPL